MRYRERQIKEMSNSLQLFCSQILGGDMLQMYNLTHPRRYSVLFLGKPLARELSDKMMHQQKPPLEDAELIITSVNFKNIALST